MSSAATAAVGNGEFESAPIGRRVVLSSELVASIRKSCGVAFYASGPQRSQPDSLRQARRPCLLERVLCQRTDRDE